MIAAGGRNPEGNGAPLRADAPSFVPGAVRGAQRTAASVTAPEASLSAPAPAFVPGAQRAVTDATADAAAARRVLATDMSGQSSAACATGCCGGLARCGR